MKLPNIANVVDIEHDEGKIIEIGLTTISLKEYCILKTYSIPIKPDFEISKNIVDLTGWTTNKLIKQGIEKHLLFDRLNKYGFQNRLLISDQANEFDILEKFNLSKNRMNVSVLYSLITGNQINEGLSNMLKYCGLEFEGKMHRGSDDSYNIAKLFLYLLKGEKNV